jgi:spore coat polysaccharide biosynthesis protein SpsF
MPSAATKQERLWRGGFGDAYTERNAVSETKLAALTANWAAILRSTIGAPPRSILEVGANVGLNLRALARLTGADLYAVEPNARAREALVADGVVPAGRALDGLCEAIPLADRSVELAFTSGVLIHIHPDNLLASCREIHRVSSRYVVCIEYFAATPEEVLYRDQSDALFKRDFGSFYLDNFPDLAVLDCGFSWKRTTGLDDLTWWVFRKRAWRQTGHPA